MFIELKADCIPGWIADQTKMQTIYPGSKPYTSIIGKLGEYIDATTAGVREKTDQRYRYVQVIAGERNNILIYGHGSVSGVVDDLIPRSGEWFKMRNNLLNASQAASIALSDTTE